MKKINNNVSTISNNNTLIKSPLLLNLTADQWEQLEKEAKLISRRTTIALEKLRLQKGSVIISQVANAAQNK